MSVHHLSPADRFAPTQWTVVLNAAADNATIRRQALQELIVQYWYPLYTWLRRQGEGAESAEDMTQAFFARLIEKQDFRQIDPARGRFRAFLLAAIKHFAANERDKLRAQKRGGAVKIFCLNGHESESRYQLEPASHLTPDRLFDRQWALTVLDRVLQRLRSEYRQLRKEPLFDGLKDALTGEADQGYAAIGQRLGISESAARVATHRLRKRYRQLLRDEIAQTVADPAMVDDELRDLMNSL